VNEIREQVAKQHEAMRQVGDEASGPGTTVERIAAPSQRAANASSDAGELAATGADSIGKNADAMTEVAAP